MYKLSHTIVFFQIFFFKSCNNTASCGFSKNIHSNTIKQYLQQQNLFTSKRYSRIDRKQSTIPHWFLVCLLLQSNAIQVFPESPALLIPEGTLAFLTVSTIAQTLRQMLNF